MNDGPRILFRFASIERSITVDEALTLGDWLHLERNVAAQRLFGRLDEALKATNEALELDADERVALCEVLSDAEVETLDGLGRLRVAFCGPALDQPESEA